ncbi:hypothetical protein DPMN_092170 [Dreissena polymorpha]|uniref:Uncharacterized protein n=1 Tax=Dreissena polymorpha TaxID=45954 RepID=A0A9D4QZS1_DREPO|nr:hypothetical protein DPMN_092170 [Dreissena polymorpha]
MCVNCRRLQCKMGPQEDYIETVFTCEGDYHDPHLQDRLEDFQRSLKDLLRTGSTFPVFFTPIWEVMLCPFDWKN